MKRGGLLLCSMALAVGLSGCISGGGVFNGLGDDPMAMIKITKSDFDPRTGENPISYYQYLAVQDLATALKIQADWQTSSTAEAMFTNGLPYGMAGAAGGAFTGLLYPMAGALAGPAAGVTGLVYGFGGAVNGAVTHSYSAVYVMGDAIEKAMRDHERDPRSKYRDASGASLFRNLHATAAFTRSRNWINSPAPELQRVMQQQPRWSGPRTGYPYPAPAPAPAAPAPFPQQQPPR